MWPFFALSSSTRSRARSKAAIGRYPKAREVVWVQEEPRNQGACAYLLESLNLFSCLRELQTQITVARPYSAAPAVGSHGLHLDQQKTIVSDALRLQSHAAQKKKTA